MIKTNCIKCIFKENGCLLQKEVAITDSEQFTEGYCRHKRTQYPEQDINKAFSEINNEESQLSLLVLHFKNDPEKLAKTIKSIEDSVDFVTQVIIVTNGLKPEKLSGLVNNVSRNVPGWMVVDLKIEYEPGVFEAVHSSVPSVKRKWFLPIMSGDEFTQGQLKEMHRRLANCNDNVVAFYFDLKDPMKVAANKTAFDEMYGHIGEPWFDKVKRFSNWEKVCHKIN